MATRIPRAKADASDPVTAPAADSQDGSPAAPAPRRRAPAGTARRRAAEPAEPAGTVAEAPAATSVRAVRAARANARAAAVQPAPSRAGRTVRVRPDRELPPVVAAPEPEDDASYDEPEAAYDDETTEGSGGSYDEAEYDEPEAAYAEEEVGEDEDFDEEDPEADVEDAYDDSLEEDDYDEDGYEEDEPEPEPEPAPVRRRAPRPLAAAPVEPPARRPAAPGPRPRPRPAREAAAASSAAASSSAPVRRAGPPPSGPPAGQRRPAAVQRPDPRSAGPRSAGPGSAGPRPAGPRPAGPGFAAPARPVAAPVGVEVTVDQFPPPAAESKVRDFPAGTAKEEAPKEKKQRRSFNTVVTKGFNDILNKIGAVAQLVGVVCAAILVVYVLLVASDANANNEIYRWFMRRSNNDLVYGFRNLFNPKTAKAKIVENYLTAAAVYLVAGALIRRVLRR